VLCAIETFHLILELVLRLRIDGDSSRRSDDGIEGFGAGPRVPLGGAGADASEEIGQHEAVDALAGERAER
jgi:hypothetical protein